jgi:hypothetical protein
MAGNTRIPRAEVTGIYGAMGAPLRCLDAQGRRFLRL